MLAKWYLGKHGGLNLPDIYLTGEENPRKNLTQEICPDRGSKPGPLRDRRHATACSTAVDQYFCHLSGLITTDSDRNELFTPVCVFACAQACVQAWMRACEHECVRAWVRMCVCVRVCARYYCYHARQVKNQRKRDTSVLQDCWGSDVGLITQHRKT